MLWQWMLQVWHEDPLVLGQAAFVWLAAIAIGLGWYASKIPPRLTPEDLDRLHREVDDLAKEIRSADANGRPVEHLQRLLSELCERLPTADARRTCPRDSRR